MSKLIQKAGFLNPKRAGRYMNYIATRDGVELLDENADSIYMRYTDTTLASENTSSAVSHTAQSPSDYLLNSTVRLFHQMGQIFRENAAPPSNPMGIRVDSKRRKKLIQKRLAMGHKQDDHEQAQGYEQSL